MTDSAPPYISNRPLRPPRRAAKQVRAENTPLLREIGYLVRNERAKRGMTRKMLAKQTGTSERYLAQIELGEGNPSVLTLDAIARGLGLDLFDLLPAVKHDEARRRALVHLRQLPVEEIKGFLDAFARVAKEKPATAYEVLARTRAVELNALLAKGDRATFDAKVRKYQGYP